MTHPIVPSGPSPIDKPEPPAQQIHHSGYLSQVSMLLFTKNMIHTLISQVQSDQARLEKSQKKLERSE
jgi:hypothetical protein